MAKNRGQLHDSPSKQGQQGGTVYSLEEILAEYAHLGQEEVEDAVPVPVRPARGEGDNVVPFPQGEQEEQDDQQNQEDQEDQEEKEENFFTQRLRRLRQTEQEYAEHMFEQEEIDPEVLRAEALIPGSDEEEKKPRRERRPRPDPAPPPDLPPAELARRYGKGLSLLRIRSVAVFFLSALILSLAFAPVLGLSLPFGLGDNKALAVYLSAGLLALSMLISADVLTQGILGLLKGRPGMDSLTALACAATLADSLTMLRLGGREGALPYCGAASLGLGFLLLGAYLKRKGLWLSCRVAAVAAEPYLVTLDEAKWDGRAAYAKISAPLHGFGSQVQSDDGAQRMFRPAAALLMLACLCFSVISSLGTRQPHHFLWCLSATLTACASYSGLLCYGMPLALLSARLAKSGAALAGWDGVAGASGGSGILLTDTDLFPPGTVSLNGIKVFGDFSVEKVVSLTATVIRESGSGLEKIFDDLLRTQGGTYRRVSEFCCYEGGGYSAQVGNEHVLVGTAALMNLMEVPLPQGLGVKNAVFCAIDGELACIFALNYTLHSAISPALTALIRNRIHPVMATRDFNLIPAMLRQRFKLPTDKMAFPNAMRRMELSDPRQEHSPILTAVLCREGLAPFSEAVVGARRLKRATRLSAGLAVAGSCAGALLAFYLTYISAYASLSAASLTVFLLLWTVPTLLISGWVDRY